MTGTMQPGQELARGVCRHLRRLGFSALTEFVPERGRRVDVIALGPKGEIWIVECKSSRADFMSDSKWEGYLPWCERFFWAVPGDFPTEILPDGGGLIYADAWDAEVQIMPDEIRLPAARRKSLTLKIARTGLSRLLLATDPDSF